MSLDFNENQGTQEEDYSYEEDFDNNEHSEQEDVSSYEENDDSYDEYDDEYEEVSNKSSPNKKQPFATSSDVIDTLTDEQVKQLAIQNGWHDKGQKTAREWMKSGNALRDKDAIMSLMSELREVRKNQNQQILYAVQQERMRIENALQSELQEAISEGDHYKANQVFQKQQQYNHNVMLQNQQIAMMQQQDQEHEVNNHVQLSDSDRTVVMNYMQKNSWYDKDPRLTSDFDVILHDRLSKGYGYEQAIAFADRSIKANNPHLNGRKPNADVLGGKKPINKTRDLDGFTDEEKHSIRENLKAVEEMYSKNSIEYQSFKSSIIKDMRSKKKAKK